MKTALAIVVGLFVAAVVVVAWIGVSVASAICEMDSETEYYE